ncbi:MAG: FeoB-associated Cys-rich membrane protein, partial [Clostridia bacterium]|nr:FeoB-associated Cys-rich membrane protein [Clostridia bacterium]
MAAFFAEHGATMAVGGVLLLIVGLIIGGMIRNRKKGKSSGCGCGCGECAMSEYCHSK